VNLWLVKVFVLAFFHVFLRRSGSDVESRVTRLGEFSPLGRSISFGQFLKITEVAQMFGHFFHGKGSGCIKFDVKLVGLHFAQFFH
jgi:hypothetical protein